MDDLQLLIDLHRDTPRQGPGSDSETLKALNLSGLTSVRDGSPNSPPVLNVVDLGCGTGASTLVLAHHLVATITAVDMCSEFLAVLHQATEAHGLSGQISTQLASIDQLPFETDSIDLIWSEGAIYNIGFEAGLQYWRQFLRDRGIIAVSEITWLTASRPRKIEQYWLDLYPEINTTSNKIKVMEQNGYSPLAFFTLPPYCWIDQYYAPLKERFSDFLERHHYSDRAQFMVSQQQQEIDLFNTYQDYFGYGFYIAQKI